MRRVGLDIRRVGRQNASLSLGGQVRENRGSSRGKAAPSGVSTSRDVPASRRSAATPPDEVRPVTALFADIVGSTSFGEVLGTEEIKVLIGECVTLMSDVVEGCGGTIGAYMGDGIAAFFGVEVATEEDHVRAAMAALEIRRVIGVFADEVEAAWGIKDLNVRVGINAGRVATGVVGHRRRQVVALGDAVNVAARLQAMAEPGKILVGEGVANTLNTRFVVRGLGAKKIKGRSASVQTFELIDESCPKQVLQSELVGRDEELTRLTSVMADLRSGRGQVLLIVGDAGIGKSTLLGELRSRAGDAVTWLDTRSDFTRLRKPYEPFVDALRQWLGLNAASPDVAVRVRLQARLRTLSSSREESVGALARLLGARLTPAMDRRLDGLPIDVLRRHLHESYCYWLEAIAENGPVVLAIDGFGESDEATIQLAERLLDLTDRVPLLLVLTMRPDTKCSGWALRVKALADFAHRTTELQLSALDDESARTLITNLDRGRTLELGVVTSLIKRGEGNPLYLEELFNAVTGHEAGPGYIDESAAALPPALDGLLFSRIDALPLEARTLLQGAAILGREFEKRVLVRMNLVDDAEAALSVLLRADLIRERKREPKAFAFKHGLLRVAVLTTLTERATEMLHARSAEAIVSVFGGNLRDYAADLVQHYFAAGDDDRAIALLEGLGERLASIYEYEDAIEALERCRAHLRASGPHATYQRVNERLAELRAAAGDTESAIRLLSEIETEAPSPAAGTKAMLIKTRVLFDGGELAKAQQCVRESLTAVDSPTERVRAIALAAQVALRLQNFDDVGKLLEELHDFSSMEGEVVFDVASARAGYHAGCGEVSIAKEWAERALAAAQSVQRASLELKARRQLGLLCLLEGEIFEAHTALKVAYSEYRRLGHAIGALECGVSLLHTSQLLGRLEEGAVLASELRPIAQGAFWAGLLSVNLASILFELDDLIEAEASATSVLGEGGDSVRPLRLSARLLLAQIAAARHAWAAVDEHMLHAQSEASHMDGPHGQLLILRTVSAELALRRGDAPAAVAEATLGFEHMGLAEPSVQVVLLRTLGTALATSGDPEGVRILEDARGRAHSMTMPIEEARILVSLAAFSDRPQGETLLQESRRLFESCACARGLAELDAAGSFLVRA